MIDTNAIEEHIRGILVALGDDPEREGLKDTPKRVANMYKEVFEGMCYSNDEIAKMFDKCFEDTTTGDLVVIDNRITILAIIHHEHNCYCRRTHAANFVKKERLINWNPLFYIEIT